MHTVIGKPDANRVGLRPNFSQNQPPNNVPIVPPTPNIDATQAVSDMFNGPEANGDSADSSTNIAAELQPKPVPYDMVIIFAIIGNHR